jgi:hypothetical protein
LVAGPLLPSTTREDQDCTALTQEKKVPVPDWKGAHHKMKMLKAVHLLFLRLWSRSLRKKALGRLFVTSLTLVSVTL